MRRPIEDLNEYVWRRLGIRRLTVRRKTVDELVEASIANWDHEALSNANGEKEREIVALGMTAAVKRSHQLLGDYEGGEYGFIWMILLQSLVSIIIQILIKWWLESPRNRVMMAMMRKELGG